MASPYVRSFAPMKPSRVSAAAIDELAAVLAGAKRVLVVTGAGISTDSGIPDYRSPGRPPHKPIQHNDFMASDKVRKRYWSRSFVGYPVLSRAKPNMAHVTLAHLAREGRLAGGLVTQNVDGIHKAAGHPRPIVELHGSIHKVVCVGEDRGKLTSELNGCGLSMPRHEMQEMLAAANPIADAWLTESLARESASVRPDGDMNLEVPGGEAKFAIPHCPSCSGVLKPGVVFFGGTVPRDTTTAASLLVSQCDALLALGTTLHVMSSFRLARAVVGDGKPLAIVGWGETRADDIATVNVQGHLGTVLDQLSECEW